MKKIFILSFGMLLYGIHAIAQTTTFNYTGTLQTFTVPAGVTSINIDARGAQGGGSFGGAGGLGARMTGIYSVTPGQVLTIVVGQQGLLQVGGNPQNSSGGGGGTFVYDNIGPTLLVAAGGGGGKCNWTSSSPLHTAAAGQVTTTGGASSDGNPGGTGGNGGPAGLWSGTPCAGGGAGWLSVGGGPYGGLSYATWTGGPGFCGGGGGGCGGVGGFGGGGGGGNHYGGGGGGGGYSGGGGGTDPTHGGGGGSYSIGTSQVNTAGYQTGDGIVIITELGGIDPCASDTVDPVFTLCPSNIIISNDPGNCTSVVSFSSPMATDNCGSVSATDTFNYTGTLQTFTVPAGVTSINIDARGAQGGGSFGGAGGLGARMTGTYSVTPGQVLTIVVGQQGLLQVGGNPQNSSGGGGGTFVYDNIGPTLLVAAGGGGGKCNWTSSSPLHTAAAGQVTTTGGASSDGNPGGTGGNGGPGGLWSGTPCAGGGAGWLSVGGGPYGGLSYATWTGGPGFCGGGGGGCGGVGGFGGGGGGGNHYGGGGGGGGYSGGGGGTDPTHGGGGGSYSIGTSQVNTAGYQTGNGVVIISYTETGIAISQTAGLASGSTFPLGVTTNTFVATDNNGNTATCTFTVTVNDTESPVADSVLLTTLNAQCSITPTAPTANDNCAGTITATTTTSFPITAQGSAVVTWIYTDGNGNSSTQTQTVIIDDNIAPVPDNVSLPGLTGCSVAISSVPTASDNCGSDITATTTDPLTYTTVGVDTVTWVYDDGNGNTTTQIQVITVVDCSGINELMEIGFNLYPNPNGGVFNIDLNTLPYKNTEIKVMDAIGRILYSQIITSQNTYYNFGYLSAGTYYVQLSSPLGRTTKTMIISH